MRMAMEAQWLYIRNGFTAGPVTSSRLAQMILDRQLKRSTIVCSVANGLWLPASEAKEVVQKVNRSIAGACFDEKELRLFNSYLAQEGRGSSALSITHLQPIFANLSWKSIPFLSLLTLGLFQIYWFIRQGVYSMTADPYMRRNMPRVGFFFLIIPLLSFVAIDGNKQLRQVRVADFSPYLIGILWYVSIALCFVHLFPGDLFLSRLVNFFAFCFSNLPLMMAQRYINECYQRLGFD